MSGGEHRDATRVVKAGLPPARQGEPFLPGPTFAAPFHLAGEASPAGYARYGNPTWALYERALAELEGGETVAFASGMAALSALVYTHAGPGEAIVLPADGYFTLRTLAAEWLEPRGVEVRRVPTREAAHAAIPGGAKLVLVETPSNPLLDVCDVAELARRAHDAGALLAVDNTLATPLGQRPLELGADFSVSSDTKGMTGHSDLLLGHVSAADPGRADELRRWRGQAGAVPGPFETWLAHRSLATLDVRLERECATAQALAELLAGRDDVEEVRYPGLAADPSHGLAARQMTRFGPVVSFTLAGAERAQGFLSACELVVEATSFGGVHTSAERRGRWGTDEVPEGFIRLSVGCEHADDVLGDVARALDASLDD